MPGIVKIPNRIAGETIPSDDTNNLMNGLLSVIGDSNGEFSYTLKKIADYLEVLTKPSYKNLKVKVNETNPTYQIDLSFDALRIDDLYLESFSETLDITVSGVLGLDTGSEATDAWYYVWVISKDDETVSAILSASSTSPTLPSGYTKKRLVSYVYNNSSGNFERFIQTDTKYFYTDDGTSEYFGRQYVNAYCATNTWYAYDLDDYIPETIKNICIQGQTNQNTETINILTQGYIDAQYVSQHIWCIDEVFLYDIFYITTTSRQVRHRLNAIVAIQLYLIMNIRGFEVPLEPY